MTIHATIEKLNEMKLYGMVRALKTTMETGRTDEYTPEDFLAYLVETEHLDRSTRVINRRLGQAKFRYPAHIEDVDFSTQRGLHKGLFMNLAAGHYLTKKENLIITGATGTGKSYLASALGNQACHHGHKVTYYNAGKLFSHLKISKVDNSHVKELQRIAKQDLLILDDFGLQPLDNESRLFLYEILEDRVGVKSTIVTSQIPVSVWHELIGESTIADAILDRLVHSSHRIELAVHVSMRQKLSPTKEVPPKADL